MTPRIYKAWKMVILLVGGTLNTVTTTALRNFESISTKASGENSHLSVAGAPRGWWFARYSQLPFVSISFLHEPPFRVFGSSRRSFLPELHVVSASFFIFTFFFLLLFFFFLSLILPGPPFRVFDPPGSAFLPRPPFRVFDLPRCSFHI